MARESRRDLIKQDIDLLKPIDILKLGTDEDPCFGKLHDLKAPECKRCGDSEFCSIIMAQNLHLKRDKLNKSKDFLDLEEAKIVKDMDKVKLFIQSLYNRGLPYLKVRVKVNKKFPDVNKAFIREYFNQLKNK